MQAVELELEGEAREGKLEMVLGEAELGGARQWVPSEDMEVATGIPSSVSTGPGQQEAAVLRVIAMLGAAAPGPRGGPAPAFPVGQQGTPENW